MGIFDKIKDEAEKLMHGHRQDGAQTAQDTVRPQGGPPDEGQDQNQAGSLDQDLSHDGDTGQDNSRGQGHGW